jgi:hypothetical protein
MRLYSIIGMLALVLTVPGLAQGQERDGGEWSSEPLAGLLPGGEETEETDRTLVGRIVEREDPDAKGSSITSYFLERDDGDLIPLPCERREPDAGFVERAAGDIFGSESCGDFLGQRVEIIGDVQSIQKGSRKIRRLGKITKIVAF